MRKRKNVFASLDLGLERIRLLVVKKKFSGLELLVNQTFDRHDLSLLNQSLQRYRPQETILLLPNERVLVRDVNLPLANNERIKSMLYFELTGQIPYGMSQVKVDYILLDKSRDGVQLKAFILPQLFSQEMEVFKKAGIEITRFMPRGLALVGYAEAEALRRRLVQLTTASGQLVVFADLEHYFSKMHFPGEVIDPQELREILEAEGVEADRWELLEIKQPDADLWGAVQFYQKHPQFNLSPDLMEKSKPKPLVLAIVSVILLILLVNFGIFYAKYLTKSQELAWYQENLAVVLPRTEEIKQLTTETIMLRERFDQLQQLYTQNKDYLIWLRELHLLLEKDTEVSILVFEDNLLRELQGKGPSATKVSTRLQSSPYFESPEFIAPIKPRETLGQMVEEFSITAVLKYPLSEEEVTDE